MTKAKKVLEEVWSLHPDKPGRLVHWDNENGRDERAPGGSFWGEYMRIKAHDHDEVMARAMFAACAPEALKMLLESEWVTTDVHGHTYCPWCSSSGLCVDDLKHHDNCRLVALLRKAGLR